ncbi:hypothetical protein ACLM5H_20795 [Fredinandcohnia humi]
MILQKCFEKGADCQLAEKTEDVKKKRAKKFVPSEKHKDKTEPWQKLYQLVEEKLKKS